MPVYSYLIEVGDGGTWWPERDDARGTGFYEETTAAELAGIILSNRLDDAGPDEDPGYFRVLVWAGPGEGTEADAAAIESSVPDPDDLVTEYVSENYQPRPGQMATRWFWIAYPAHVAGYGHMADRVSRATGTGDTRDAALTAARTPGGTQ